MKMIDLGSDDRPREKMMEHGPAILSNSELLAVLLRTGTRKENALEVARNLLKAAGGSLTELSSMSFEAMTNVSGVGGYKACSVAAAMELGRRFSAESYPYERMAITSAAMLYRALYPKLKGLDREQCWVVYLNRSNFIIGMEMVSEGGFAETVIDVKMILKHALERKAAQIVLSHNHPSGNPRPGKEDIENTRMLSEACNTMGLVLLDHIIFADSSYFSFSDDKVTLINP
ncbi:MAG: DNA repair protein RadC [Bacteroidales bacterium]|nr:DNA repair protein RadC [Bacteroidales bacterium]